MSPMQVGLWDNEVLDSNVNVFDNDVLELARENEAFLTQQLVTYIGNKRSLLEFIGNGLEIVRKRLGKNRITSFDVFSGSGVVARYLKKYSEKIIANDLEEYSAVINRCYLTNKSDVDFGLLDHLVYRAYHAANRRKPQRGFYSRVVFAKRYGGYKPRRTLFLYAAQRDVSRYGTRVTKSRSR